MPSKGGRPPRVAAVPEIPVEQLHLQALGALGEASFANPGDVFEQGLALLIRQLGVDRAVVSIQTESGLESLWSAPETGLDGLPEALAGQILAGEGRTLVVRDAALEAPWLEPGSGLRSCLGTALRHSGQAMGVLSVQNGVARDWRRSEVAMLTIMAHLFSRTFEVESLRAELWKTRQALDLTSAVVEDSALENAETGLPNPRYLAVWIRSSLFLARRRGETMAVAAWEQPLERRTSGILKGIADSLRGEDLLVDLGEGRMLLLLPRTDRSGAGILLGRLHQVAGGVAMGATLWNPLLKPDRDDHTLDSGIRRARLALAAARPGEIRWKLVKASRENLIDSPNAWDENKEEQH
jgi:hypothetical protein